MSEPTSQVLRKEDKLRYLKAAFSIRKGTLVLTTTELSFVNKDEGEIEFSIPLKNILSAIAQKKMSGSKELLIVVYTENGKEKKVKIQHFSMTSLSPVVNVFNMGHYYFSAWEQAINQARTGPSDFPKSNGIDLLERLAGLKEKGILSEEEFAAQKKTILGM